MAKDPRRSQNQPNPAELRGVFGANLRRLGSSSASISALCRELGINRTQFNRYLAGESFPRPDVLYRICTFFGVDARILLEDVDEIEPSPEDLLHHPFVSEFVGAGAMELSEDDFPSGFYRFSRASFTDETRFVIGLVHVRRIDGLTFLRGYEHKEAMAMQDVPTDPRNREYRGFVVPQAEGIAAIASRWHALSSSFNFLARVPAIENNYWVGYATRTTTENPTGRRATRLVYEHLGFDTHKVLTAARQRGFCSAQQLIPFHRQQLRITQPFT